MTGFDPFSASVAAGASVLNTISTLGPHVKQYMEATQQRSLIELSSPARVEPLCVVSSDLANLEYTGEVMRALTSIFAGYYMQAVAATCTVSGLQAMKNLDRLNPNRSVDTGDIIDNVARVAGWGAKQMNAMGGESMAKGLGQLSTLSFTRFKLSSEAVNVNDYDGTHKTGADFGSADSTAPKHGTDGPDVGRYDRNNSGGTLAAASFTANDVMKDHVSLSVGKLLNLEIETEDKVKVTIPVAVRLMAATVPDHVAAGILSIHTQNHSFSERWHGFRSGRLSFVKDLILCQDLIDADKKAMIQDKTGIYRDIIARTNDSKIAFGMDPNRRSSLNTASTLYVISEAVQAQIEEIGFGKFTDKNFRDKVFHSGYAMIIVVVDRQWERVRFYHRGIAEINTVAVRDLKSANKGSGIDVEDVMKAFLAGNSPRF